MSGAHLNRGVYIAIGEPRSEEDPYIPNVDRLYIGGVQAQAYRTDWLFAGSTTGNYYEEYGPKLVVDFGPAEPGSVPEPATLGLLCIAGAGLLALLKRRRD